LTPGYAGLRTFSSPPGSLIDSRKWTRSNVHLSFTDGQTGG
jgi:hypothetical protein